MLLSFGFSSLTISLGLDGAAYSHVGDVNIEVWLFFVALVRIIIIVGANRITRQIQLRVIVALFELFALAVELLPQVLLLLRSHALSIKLGGKE